MGKNGLEGVTQPHHRAEASDSRTSDNPPMSFLRKQSPPRSAHRRNMLVASVIFQRTMPSAQRGICCASSRKKPSAVAFDRTTGGEDLCFAERRADQLQAGGQCRLRKSNLRAGRE